MKNVLTLAAIVVLVTVAVGQAKDRYFIVDETNTIESTFLVATVHETNGDKVRKVGIFCAIRNPDCFPLAVGERVRFVPMKDDDSEAYKPDVRIAGSVRLFGIEAKDGTKMSTVYAVHKPVK